MAPPARAKQRTLMLAMSSVLLGLLLAGGLQGAWASHAPASAVTSSTASDPSGLLVRFTYPVITPGQPTLVNVTISQGSGGAPVRWRDLQVDAARRMHIMVAGCDSFQHVHAEDFAALPPSSPLHLGAPQDEDTTFQVWINLPTAGRYVAGVEFVPTATIAQGQEQVAYLPLVAPAQRGDDAPLDTSCHVHDDTHDRPNSTAAAAAAAAGAALQETTSLRHFHAWRMASGVNVDVMRLEGSVHVPPPPATAGTPSDPDLVTVQLALKRADTPMAMGDVQPVDGAQQQQQLQELVTGVCYRFELTFWDYGGGGRPVEDLEPWLTHTMHLAVMPLSSLWSLDHFHALAVGKGMSAMPAEACDMADGDMPEAPPAFGPRLVAYWRFSRPGAFRVMAQTVRSGGRMLLPFWSVRVTGRIRD